MPLKPRKPAKKRVPWTDEVFTILGRHLQREKAAREQEPAKKRKPRKT
jgi:hypothetical protein